MLFTFSWADWFCHAFLVGKEGPITQALLNLIVEDMKSGPSTVRIPVPY